MNPHTADGRASRTVSPVQGADPENSTGPNRLEETMTTTTDEVTAAGAAEGQEQPSPPEEPARKPRSRKTKTEPETAPDPDRPLTKEEKHALGAAVVKAAAAVTNSKTFKALPSGTAAKQVANWLSYVPTGGAWDDRLPDRPKH